MITLFRHYKTLISLVHKQLLTLSRSTVVMYWRHTVMHLLGYLTFTPL